MSNSKYLLSAIERGEGKKLLSLESESPNKSVEITTKSIGDNQGTDNKVDVTQDGSILQSPRTAFSILERRQSKMMPVPKAYMFSNESEAITAMSGSYETKTRERLDITQDGSTSPATALPVGSSSQKKKGGVRATLKNFVYTLFDPKFESIRDLYPVMFILDVICIICFCFGYRSFAAGGSGIVVQDIISNRVPFSFVCILHGLAVIMVVDRAIYLRKSIRCKIIFDVIFFAAVITVLFVLPLLRESTILPTWSLRFMCFFKFLYYIVSLYQIRKGYPTLSIEQFAKESYGLVIMTATKLNALVPFLFELRTAVDWAFTDTSLSFCDFFNVELWYNTVYYVKCKRVFEKNYPSPNGKARSIILKLLLGLVLIVFVIVIILSPLTIFSMLNLIGTNVELETVLLSVSVNEFPPLYIGRAERDTNLLKISKNDDEQVTIWRNRFGESCLKKFMNGGYETSVIRDKSKQAGAFLGDYQSVHQIRFHPESSKPWIVTKDKRCYLQNLLAHGEDVSMNIRLHFHRLRSDEIKEPKVLSTSLDKIHLNQKMRNALHIMLGENNCDENSTRRITKEAANKEMVLPLALPMFFHVVNQGYVEHADKLLDAAKSKSQEPMNRTYDDLVLTVSRVRDDQMYWTVQQKINDGILDRKLFFDEQYLEYGANRGLKYLQILAFVDKEFPAYIPGYFVGGGIIVMYVVVVVTFGQLVRRIIACTPQEVMILEMANPDPLLRMFQDIYIARELGDFEKEQELQSRLVMIFRSNATLTETTAREDKVS
ncbi:piezo non-specific cation channel, r-Ras-binding domain-containing protein [Ditylenchus destructor]|nr:piezo non-specific cation channel, r-Ras-binding domain-containing protein [Ditylenchus destructor]